MKFVPFQNLYSNLKRTDLLLYQAMDKISSYLEDIYNHGVQSQAATPQPGTIGPGTGIEPTHLGLPYA